MDWEQRCKELEQRVEELERENQELRCKLGYAEPVLPLVTETPKNEMVLETAAGIHMRSTPEEKIRLFRSLFRGREDVFARRWYSVQKEKGGYAPVCANEWRYGVCIKPKGKCSKCENRVLVPLDDTIIYKHLSGKDAHGQDVIDLYPILAEDAGFEEGGLAVRQISAVVIVFRQKISGSAVNNYPVGADAHIRPGQCGHWPLRGTLIITPSNRNLWLTPMYLCVKMYNS